MLEFGDKRGDINQNNYMKIHYKDESFWIKVIAINKKENQVIGVLANQLLCGIKWGTIVIAKEIEEGKLFEMIDFVLSIPNDSNWEII